jgi:hypothetical protein
LCAEVLGVSGVAVSVLASGGDDMVWRTDGLSVRLDDLQFTLGEGPGVDAAASGELVLEPDLGAVPVQRWPVFTPAALELGVRAVFAVPLQIGAIRVGVLVAQRDAPGLMDGGVLTDLLVFAGAATDALLGSVTGSSEPRWLSGQGSGPLPDRLSPAAWPHLKRTEASAGPDGHFWVPAYDRGSTCSGSLNEFPIGSRPYASLEIASLHSLSPRGGTDDRSHKSTA